MFFPIGDDNSRRRSRPMLVWAILAANAAVWVLQLMRGEPFTNGWSAIPYELTQGVDLRGVALVEMDGRAFPIRHYPGPAPIQLTLLSSMFMHGSWLHIIGNMVYLVVFADQIEDRLGRVRFLAFYLLCGLAAGLAQVLWDPAGVIPCLGASGAIAGALGAYLVTYPTNAVRVLILRSIVVLPAWVVLGGWIVLQLVSHVGNPAGQATGVAYLAHIGGFLAGIVLVFILGIGRKRAGMVDG